MNRSTVMYQKYLSIGCKYFQSTASNAVHPPRSSTLSSASWSFSYRLYPSWLSSSSHCRMHSRVPGVSRMKMNPAQNRLHPTHTASSNMASSLPCSSSRKPCMQPVGRMSPSMYSRLWGRPGTMSKRPRLRFFMAIMFLDCGTSTASNCAVGHSWRMPRSRLVMTYAAPGQPAVSRSSSRLLHSRGMSHPRRELPSTPMQMYTTPSSVPPSAPSSGPGPRPAPGPGPRTARGAVSGQGKKRKGCWMA
mmetsp:Transcript_36140/g.101835  ORF Transcript_36140/g.101835 Transcript_36140/m.101835 type:complete len:247 (-) Transcript_36140:311-1051(-)